MNQISEKIISKLTSGRWWLTITACGVFAYVSVKKTIPEEAIIAVIMYIVQAYFNRKDGGNDQNGVHKPSS